MSWSDDRAVDAVHWQILKNHLKPNVWPTSREMFKYKQELDSTRHTDLNQLANSIQDMKKKLSYLKKTASDVNKIKTVGFENFRKDIKTFECKLSKLKEGCSKKLREECLKQSTLIKDIERVKRIALHDGGLKPNDGVIVRKKQVKTARRVPISKNTYASKEIADFHDYCARNYGRTGGWSSKDHETFMKIRSKYADGVDFINNVVQAMPHITENAAREHENWFVKFEELKARQKEAIIKWKNEKKNVIVNDCIPNISEVSKKSTDNDAKITLNTDIDNLEDDEIHDTFSEPQCEIVETKKFKNCDKMLLKHFRDKDKRYVDAKKMSKQRLDCERTKSDPITIVTLHGKSDNYRDGTESLEKFPNVHFSIYGARNQDVKVVMKYQ